MASSSENLMSNIDPLVFMRPSMNDYWFPDLFPRDTETLTLTRALQKSLEPAVALAQTPTPTVSGLSASDPETPPPFTAAASEEATPKRHRNGVAGGKITKRKSRATKRSQTTFITADAANFRQMVQQVTGVRLGGVAAAAQFSAPVIKPEPLRGFGSASRFPLGGGGGGGCPPTLDTSALLLDQNRAATPAAVSPVEDMTCQAISATPYMTGAGMDFDAVPSFPTLESWKVM